MSNIILKEHWKYFVIVLILALLIYFPLFLYLGTLPIIHWDESRLAMNAYEMYQNGNFLIPTYEGKPDMWNTKPPLMIWFQVLSMKLFGVNEVAVRLPSALAAVFTCFIILLFCVKYLKNFWLGFIAVLVLVTSSGYIDIHATRTGDYDALLTFFLTSGSIVYLVFLDNVKSKFLYLFFIALTLALLTKSSAALMILPGLFIYTVFKRKLLLLLKNKHLYFGLLIFIVGTLGYYFLREIYNPGYLKAVMTNEFGGRFLNTIENHKHGFGYYFENLFNTKFHIWFPFILFGLIVGGINKDEKIKNLTLFSFITVLTYLLVISSSQTKLNWYDVPIYPFLALVVGIFLYYIFSLLNNKEKIIPKILSYIALVLIFMFPYQQIILKISKDKKQRRNIENYGVSNYLRDILKGNNQNDNFSVVYDSDFTHGKFYLYQLQKEGKNIVRKNFYDDFEKGEILLISQGFVKDSLEKKFELNTIETVYRTSLLEITGEKVNH